MTSENENAKAKLMVSEEVVDGVLQLLPQTSFLPNFVNRIAQCTDAPKGFLLQAGLACLAQAAPSSLNYAGEFPSLYFMSVGATGDSRKTTTWRVAMDVLMRCVNLRSRILKTPGSSEVLTDTLEAHPHGILIYGEGGTFLEETKEGYKKPMRANLTSLFDGLPVSRETVTKARQRSGGKGKGHDQAPPQMTTLDSSAPRPCLSFGMGVTPAYMSENLRHNDLETGFLSRFHFMFCERERELDGFPWDHHMRDFCDYLDAVCGAQVDQTGNPTVCRCAGMTPEAARLIRDHSKQLVDAQRAGMIPHMLKGIVARIHPIAKRIALVLAWENGNARTPWFNPNDPRARDFYLTEAEICAGLNISMLSLYSMQDLVGQLQLNENARDKRIILDIIRQGPGSVSTGDITLRTGMLEDKRLRAILVTLQNEGWIRLVAGPLAGLCYYTPREERWKLGADEEAEAKRQGLTYQNPSAPPQNQPGSVISLLPRLAKSS